MIVQESETQVGKLDGKLFVSLRPFQVGDDPQWHDPVDHWVARIISDEDARRDKVLPFQRAGSHVFVAAADPGSPAVLNLTEFIDGKIVLCRAEEEDIVLAQDRVFGIAYDPQEERLGSYLIASGRVTAGEVAAALEQQEQEASGARIGSILMQRGLVNHWDVAEAYARQRGLPLIDLLNGMGATSFFYDKSLQPVWDWVDERFWFRHLVVPLAVDGNTLTVAMADPQDEEALDELVSVSGRRLRVFVTGYRDIMAVLNLRFRKKHEEASRLDLVNRRPEDSAFRQINRAQAWVLILIGVAIVVGFVFRSVLTGTLLAGAVELMYAVVSVFRLWAMAKAAGQESEIIVTKADLDRVPPTSLPEYTILVPLYKEAAVLPTLTRAMQDLIYPKDRLDVKFLLEEDDAETIEAARKANLPSYIELLIVPRSEPRTKPKACNYGLTKARGEYTVIFDAEDIPEPDQLLKAITVFRQGDDHLVCVQAKLSYYNENQNILTRWFTAEYANWFELLLPSLFALNMPIPLGGTSNHLRTDVLRELGAWDPFNVAEDADLGVRLHKAGYRTGVMNSTTFEEANSDFVNWIRQRSRWVKGYMQTWLVHMRHPVRLWRELGPAGFFGFQMTVGGTPLQFLINPILWAITVLWYMFQPAFMHQIFSGWVYYVGNLCLFLGNVAFMYSNIVGVVKAERWSLAKWAVLSPVYWVLMSIASYKALNQLIFKPSYWEKTVHGLSSRVPVVGSAASTAAKFEM